MLTFDEIKTRIKPIANENGIEKFILFGSYAKGTASESSDIDLFMVSNGITGFAFFEIKSRIEDVLQTEIDLIPDIDVVPNSLIDEQIRETGVVIYEK